MNKCNFIIFMFLDIFTLCMCVPYNKWERKNTFKWKTGIEDGSESENGN